jgi:acyl-CoA thioesterase
VDFRKLKEQRNNLNSFGVHIGIVINKIELGYAEAVLTVRPDHTNPLGTVHGGCLYTLADVVTSVATVSHGYHTVTVSGFYNYLAPAKNTKEIHAVAKTIKHGNTLSVCDFELRTDSGMLVGKGTFTHQILTNMQIEL